MFLDEGYCNDEHYVFVATFPVHDTLVIIMRLSGVQVRRLIFASTAAMILAWFTSGGFALHAQVNITVNPANVVMDDFGGVGTNAFSGNLAPLTPSQKATVKQRVQYAQFPVCRFWMPSRSVLLSDPELAMGPTTFGDANPNWVQAREVLDLFDETRTKFYIANYRDDFTDINVSNKKDWAHPRWAELHALMTKHFRDEGYDFFALSPVNEGDHDDAEKDACWDYYKNAHDALTALGIRDKVKVIAGDWRGLTTDNWQWAPIRNEYCDILSGHRYVVKNFNNTSPGALGVYNTINTKVNTMAANNPGVRLIMGEFGWKDSPTTEAEINEYRRTHKAGVDAADWVVQATRGGAQMLLWWTLSEENIGAQHGMWYPAAQGMGLKPQYFMLCLMARFIKAGSTVHNFTWPDNLVRVGAFKSKEGGWTFLLVNRAASAKTVNVKVTGHTAPISLARYDYVNALGNDSKDYSQYLTDADGLPLPAATLDNVNLDAGFSVSVPSNAALLLTNVTPGYSYNGWKNAQDWGAVSEDQRDPEDDPDGDGSTNEEERAFGTNPVVPNGSYPITDFVTDGAGMVAVRLSYPKMADDVTYSMEVSPDLAQWNPAAGATEAFDSQTGRHSLNLAFDPADAPMFFRMRLRR
jgi:hypothetical protein